MPFVIGPKSVQRLEAVHPDLVAIVQRAAELSEIEFTVQEGVRSPETQAEYLKRGVTKTANSLHLIQPDGYSHAVDLVPWIAGQPRWEWGPIYGIVPAVKTATLERGVNLRWGGVWDRLIHQLPDDPDEIRAAVKEYCDRHPGPDFVDGPHYELRP